MAELPKPRLRDDGNVDMPEWTRRGKMLIRRDALDLTDPEHPMNEIERLGLDPRDFGYREEIIQRNAILALRDRLHGDPSP